MKNIYLLSLFLILCASIQAQAVSIIETSGWLESASVKWQAVPDAESYHVYYTGMGETDTQIDDILIREYDGYFRADILGLAVGSYTLKVKPVINGVEENGTETASVNVNSYDRTGFAFSNGRTPGAYKADGTPKDNAVILYITENTKNKVTLDVTGASENPCVGLQPILEGFKKGKDLRPLIVRLVGQITDFDEMLNGDIVLENKNTASSYITFEGVGEDAVADGWGIRVKNASNIEIRNIGIMNCDSGEGDNIGLQQNNDYVWVHHVDFFYGGAGGDSDQAKGDGAIDCKKSTYVTFSYNHFWDTGKSNLLGLSEGTTEGLFITYHHNWYDHSDSRHPRVRYYSAHVYNNYYDGIAKYGVGSTKGSSVFVEGNYFRNCKYPILTSMQGSDVFDESSQSNDYSDMPTFSKEDGGTIKAFNNYMEGQRRFVAYGTAGYPNSTADFDAYVASNREETIASSVVSSRGGNTYNNFDTNASVMYAYSVQSPEDAMNTVMEFAGRMNGGDFSWTFNNSVDDASYSVNSQLKTALINYQTSIISIQGDSVSSGGGGIGGGGTGGGGTGEITGDIVHNFTLSGKQSEYFSIDGNLSDSKGTVVYGGLTLSQCLKIESSTLITFTTTEASTLLLVFNDGFSEEIKIDGVSQTASNGQLTIVLQAGDHSISKDNSTNLYLMSIDYLSTENRDLKADFVNIYPNPALNTISVTTDADINKIEVYNMAGKIMKTVNHNFKNIEISSFQSGIYLVVVSTQQGVHRQTLVKK